MRIHLSDPTLVGDLVESLDRWAWHVADVGEKHVVVSAPEGVPEETARLELDLYLRVWRATHPGVIAVVEE